MESGLITVYQCKSCKTILGDGLSSVGDTTSLSLNRLSTHVSLDSPKVFCRECNAFVATLNNDSTYRLESSQIFSTPIVNVSQRIKKMEDQLQEQNTVISQLNSRIIELAACVSQPIKKMEDQHNEQKTKISQLNSRIIELGVQAITNRLDLITHKYAIEHNHTGFSMEQFKKEFNSL